MHRAVVLLLLAHSSAPISLPCGLFIIYVSPLRLQKSPALFCVVDISPGPMWVSACVFVCVQACNSW